MKLVSTFQARLKEGLSLRNIKPSEVSKATGISKPLMSYYLHGERNPNQANIYKIAHVLGVSEAWLLGYDVMPNGEKVTDEHDDELDHLISLLSPEQRRKTIEFIRLFVLK